ncbi:hypothetical protein LTR17_014195 [Elasticomyces elasticus]|nr:hypothetical protein LTR17_014195 [Elasticomyces elasticus]
MCTGEIANTDAQRAVLPSRHQSSVGSIGTLVVAGLVVLLLFVFVELALDVEIGPTGLLEDFVVETLEDDEAVVVAGLLLELLLLTEEEDDAFELEEEDFTDVLVVAGLLLLEAVEVVTGLLLTEEDEDAFELDEEDWYFVGLTGVVELVVIGLLVLLLLSEELLVLLALEVVEGTVGEAGEVEDETFELDED